MWEYKTYKDLLKLDSKKIEEVLNDALDTVTRYDLQIEREDGKVTYSFNIAGTKKEDINLEVKDNKLLLSIKGSLYSKRNINFNYEDVSSTYQDGILRVVFTIEENKPRKIKIE